MMEIFAAVNGSGGTKCEWLGAGSDGSRMSAGPGEDAPFWAVL